MATIVNNPSGDTSGGAGWAVAVIVLLVVLVVAYFGYTRFSGHTSTANINVNLPSGGGSAGGSSGGSGGGAAQ